MNSNMAVKQSHHWIDLLAVVAGATVVFWLSRRYDLLEKALIFVQTHEQWEIDELFIVAIFLTLALTVYSLHQWRETVRAGKLLGKTNLELESSLAEIKKLRDIIPICANCKKIRADDGYWEQVESYIEQHTGSRFSHGICPDCVRKLYPELADELLSRTSRPDVPE